MPDCYPELLMVGVCACECECLHVCVLQCTAMQYSKDIEYETTYCIVGYFPVVQIFPINKPTALAYIFLI